MSAIYDNWERLVAAVLKKQQLWELFHDYSRSPSILSKASDFSSSFRSRSPFDDLVPDFENLGCSSTYRRTPKLVFISDFSPSIDVKDLCLASSELLGRGTFGSSYAAAMDNGVRIVVKRLNSTPSISETAFNRHMAVVGGVKHENVVPLRAYYFSEHERLMLYDYYNKGSVHSLLHGGGGVPLANVDWETRLKIAIGAARGITKIHEHNGGKLVHGNIRASNVFLNLDQYGCVSDLGLTRMVETTFMKPAYCYAPEVKNTKNASQASDVYSFGVLLLELLTRNPTVHVPGGPQAVNLAKLVTYLRIDEDLLKLPTIRDQAVKMLQIGMRCIEKSTKKRPKIFQVLKMLEALYWMPRAHVARELVFFEDANGTFDLVDLLRASAEVLRKGTFGSSYEARLENGNTIVVKRLKDFVAVRHVQKLVHGNIRSSNFFLNGENYAIVSDAGMAKLSRTVSRSDMQNPGHCPPEVTDTRGVTQASDAHSFGVMLCELLFEKRPQTTTDDGEVKSLVEWFHSIVRGGWSSSTVFELELLNEYDEKTMVHVGMVHVEQIAMDCVSTQPERRLRMSQVVNMLEEFSGIEPQSTGSIESRLEYLLPTLTP